MNRIMNAEKLTNYLLSIERETLVDFTLDLGEIPDDGDDIFGIKITYFCDTWVVIAGEYGGGFNRTEDLTDFPEQQERVLKSFLEDYFKEIDEEIGMETGRVVAVDVENCQNESEGAAKNG